MPSADGDAKLLKTELAVIPAQEFKTEQGGKVATRMQSSSSRMVTLMQRT